jgi:DNA-binding NarL/FixJ family response regulator
MRKALNHRRRAFEIDWVVHSAPTTPQDNSLELDHSHDEQQHPESAVQENAGDTLRVSNANGPLAVIESKAFQRECLSRCLKLATANDVVSFPTVEAMVASERLPAISFVLLATDDNIEMSELRRQLGLLAQFVGTAPIVVLSNVEEPDAVLGALGSGAKGYIPTSAPLELAIEAMRLVKAGGVYVPASILLTARPPSVPAEPVVNQPNYLIFTARQRSVVEALRRGKANKIIAHELQMRESTVKVHVRNIMRKLKAKNRTEVAFLASGMLHEAS